jgi:hypothetical protein
LLDRWANWHWIRTGLGIVGFVAALRALQRSWHSMHDHGHRGDVRSALWYGRDVAMLAGVDLRLDLLRASALTTFYLMKNDRALLARRMRGGPTFEKEGT